MKYGAISLVIVLLLLLHPSNGALLVSSHFDVEFIFYDEEGRELSYDSVVQRMTMSRPDFLSSGVFDIETYVALDLNRSYESNGRWITPFPASGRHKMGLMVHWSTANTGYSNFLLDNLGRGFTEPGAFIFNEVLAYDARRQLESSLKQKKDFTPSKTFKSLQSSIDSCFSDLKSATNNSARGKTGQRCLDLVAQAMTKLLKEYGQQRARLGLNPMWGVTVTPEPELSMNEEFHKFDQLKTLFDEEHRWARITMYGITKDDYDKIGTMVDYARKNKIKTMGQLFDSTAQGSVSLSEFQTRVDDALKHSELAKFDAWEVGNEVNGGWLGSSVPAKISYAAQNVKKRYPKKLVCLTLYWYSMQDKLETSLFNWINAHLSPSLMKNIDCVGLSVYTDNEPLGFFWDQVMTRLSQLFPKKMILIGETGYASAGYWEGDPRSDRGATLFIQNRYPASFAAPNSRGGVFWWAYDKEMIKNTVRREALRKVYCETYPTRCRTE